MYQKNNEAVHDECTT